METVSKETLQQLSDFQKTNCISIYIPTHKKGKEVNELQDAKLLKNHVQDIKNQLKNNKDIPEDEAIQYLSPLNKLIDDTEFWHHQSHGLAIFLAEDFFEYFRLPYSVEEFSLLSNSFHLEQLIPAYQEEEQYYVLAASLGKVRLFEASLNEIYEVNLPESLPQGAENALSYYDFEKNLQQHSGSMLGGGKEPIYHGHGGDGEFNEAYVKEYFRHLEDSLEQVIEDKSIAVVLASVDYLHPIFKSASKKLKFTEKGLTGNYDKAKPDKIHKESLSVINPKHEALKNELKQKYQQLAGTGKTSYQIDDIAPAAVDGRIDTLFILKGTHKWGFINNEDNSVKLRQDNDSNVLDLVSKSAVETVLNGGHAYFVEKEMLPENVDNAEMAAVFRW
ncbi:hypothetical protein OKW21_002467 [Catalinimonas alkaloidigena]|uniref:baeRF7 domain-containing protein n=1 Tax=Catalinimonas alkaloidigena TaxID=1075417 RepID=UPI00240725BE|nr:hypothetical protein [Catalinimonas alkaloidigena]MDF9797204.1 hypothetical protein [Catalinimonas alkaloidigena]